MRRLPDPPFQAALLLPRWLGDAVMASALIAPLRKLSGRPVEIWAPEYLAPLFAPGESISAFKVYEGRGRHHGLAGVRRFRSEMDSEAEALWVIPDSLSSAMAARASGVKLRIGRAREGRSPLLSHALRGLRRDRKRHWIDEKADLLRPFMEKEKLGELMPVLQLSGEEGAYETWLEDEGLAKGYYDVLTPGAAYGPAKKWRDFEDYAIHMHGHIELVLAGSASEKGELDAMAFRLREKERSCIVHAGSLDLARMARLCRDARRVISNDSGAMHLAAAAGARVMGIFLSTSPRWTRPRGPHASYLAPEIFCAPCFQRNCPYGEMDCQNDIAPDAYARYDWLEEERR